MRRPRALVPLFALLLAVPALALAAQTGAAEHSPQVPCAVVACPDLTVDASRFRPYVQVQTFAEHNCNVMEGSTVPGTRTILRFNFTTPNNGTADLVLGNPGLNPLWFEFGTCHGHYHFREYADYRLWTPEQYEAWDALRLAEPELQAHEVLARHPELQPIKSDKRGFCVIDVVRYAPTAPPKWLACDLQGLSVGWGDAYYARLDGQFIDITGLLPGTYVLEGEVNAEHFFMESDYANNRGAVVVTI